MSRWSSLGAGTMHRVYHKPQLLCLAARGKSTMDPGLEGKRTRLRDQPVKRLPPTPQEGDPDYWPDELPAPTPPPTLEIRETENIGHFLPEKISSKENRLASWRGEFKRKEWVEFIPNRMHQRRDGASQSKPKATATPEPYGTQLPASFAPRQGSYVSLPRVSQIKNIPERAPMFIPTRTRSVRKHRETKVAAPLPPPLEIPELDAIDEYLPASKINVHTREERQFAEYPKRWVAYIPNKTPKRIDHITDSRAQDGASKPHGTRIAASSSLQDGSYFGFPHGSQIDDMPAPAATRVPTGARLDTGQHLRTPRLGVVREDRKNEASTNTGMSLAERLAERLARPL